MNSLSNSPRAINSQKIKDIVNGDILHGKHSEESDKFFVHNDQTRTHHDPLMSEWDDDNVIVIDLTEERSLTSANSTTTTAESSSEPSELEDGPIDILDSSLDSQTINISTEIGYSNSQKEVGYSNSQNVSKDILVRQEASSDNRRISVAPTTERLSSASSSTSSSAASQVSALDNDFHCKELAVIRPPHNKNGSQNKNASGKNSNGHGHRPLFHSLSGEKSLPYSAGKSKLLSHSKAISIDSQEEESRTNDSKPIDVLVRLHQEIYTNSKQRIEKNNNNELEPAQQQQQQQQDPDRPQSVIALAPVKVRPWEKKITKNEFLGGREVTYIRPRHHQFFGDVDGDIASPERNNVTNQHQDSNSTGVTPQSADSVLRLINRPPSKSLSSSRDGSGSAPLSVFTGYRDRSAPDAALHRRSFDRKAHPSLIYRGVLPQRQLPGENREFLYSALKARSSDFLDRMDNSVSSRGRTRSSAATGTPPSRGCVTSDKMTRIEPNLYLGSIEAATDVILLGSNAISHIVSVDSVPLPRKISAMLPRISFMHMQVSDLPDEDLLSHLGEAIAFIDLAISRGGAVLVHCFRGRSRSATVVIAYLMHKHHYKLEKAFFKVKTKRECINPHIGFLAQLKLFEAMDYTIDLNNVQYKMFRLYCASERMRKAKILFRDSLDKVLDVDPAGGLPGSAEAAAAAASKSRYPMIYKCRKCRRTLATAFNMLPHVRGETPNWMDDKWARLSEEDVIDDASSPAGLDLCSQSVFITPVGWMETEIKQNLSGKLYCPNCQVRVGTYSWVMGDLCKGCGATVLPAFQLDMTEIIFRTCNKYLQSGYTARGPILV